MRITLLCGGVGGSKMAQGLYEEFPDADLRIIVNTADDLSLLGLHISPDLDTVTYTLAGISNADTGWGLRDETFRALAMMARYGERTWFQLGDGDLATHIVRTERLFRGESLTSVTALVADSLGVWCRILPMCDEAVSTKIQTVGGWLDFQEYFVKNRYEDTPLAVRHDGVEMARITEDGREAISAADVIIVAPSNPVVSIGPILNLPGMRDALMNARATKVAVSPFIGDRSITGPAGALMQAIGYESTAAGLAKMYEPWLTHLVIHEEDLATYHGSVAGSAAMVATDTMMPDIAAKRRLARFVVEIT